MKIEHGVVTEITKSDVHDNQLIFPEEASSIAADISDLLNSRASEKIKHVDFRNVQTLESIRLNNPGLWEPVTLYKIAPHAITVRMPEINNIAQKFALAMKNLEEVYAPCLTSVPEMAFSNCPKLRLFSSSHFLREIKSSSFFKSYSLSKFIGLNLNNVNMEPVWISVGVTYSVECGTNIRNFICVRDNNRKDIYSDHSAEYVQIIEREPPKTKIYVLKDGGYSLYAGLYFQTAADIFNERK